MSLEILLLLVVDRALSVSLLELDFSKFKNFLGNFFLLQEGNLQQSQ